GAERAPCRGAGRPARGGVSRVCRADRGVRGRSSWGGRMNRRWLLAAGAAALLSTGCGYNRIQELDERVAQTRGNIEAELLRRNDLIPNLVATVDEAAAFERETFTEVAQARAGLTQASQRVAEAVQQDAETDELSRANAALSENLRLFINVAVEAYPTLQANRNFIALQDELTRSEERRVGK